MIPYDLDPTLHAQHPHPQRLDDGYSPPDLSEQQMHARIITAHADTPEQQAPDGKGLGNKSLF